MPVDPNVRVQGDTILSAVEHLLNTIGDLQLDEDGIMPTEALEDGDDILKGETDSDLRKNLLVALGALRISRGPGGLARRPPDGALVGKATLTKVRAIWEALCRTNEGRLGPAELNKFSPTGQDQDGGVAQACRVLKTLSLVVGIQKVGGIRLANAAAKDFEKAETEQRKQEGELGGGERVAREHEEVLYQPAFDFLDEVYGGEPGFHAVILGNKQLAEGKWNTPDVIGMYVKPCGSGGLPVLRLLSVEAKWRLTRDAVAEAASHRRFANYAFLLVPTAFLDIDRRLITECMEAGVGIICPGKSGAQKYHIQFRPSLNRPDEEAVDEFLNSFRGDDKKLLAERAAKEVRKLLGAVFAGS